jgi:hypothetical protein
MKRTLILALLGLFVAGTAGAATNVNLNVVGPTTVPAGSVITLQAVVTANGAETDNTVFGAVNQPTGQAVLAPLGTQVNLSTVGTAAAGWSSGSALCTTAFCTAFSQINSQGPATAGVTNLVIGQLAATLAGGLANGTVVNFNWRTTPSTQRLDWYGISSAPGASVTIGGVVPEPTTAALLGLGIFGLALSGRRRV